MTDGARVTVDGDERLAATARQAADELAEMDTANRAVGELVRARAASKAPKVSGALAGSVRADSDSAGVVIASDLVYAGVINYGWPGHNIAAQPFLTGALAEATSTIVSRYERETSDAISDIKGA